MVSYVLAAVVLLGGAARPAEPDPFEGASKLNPFGDVAAKLNPFDLVSKPNPFELGEPKCNPFYGFYEV
jgi:hypothetical protein